MIRIEDVTVCVTNFKRAGYLARAIKSVQAAGIRRITISSMCPDAQVDYLIRSFRKADWLSFDVYRSDTDEGCNENWIKAVYMARTPHIIVLHDDDCLTPEFGKIFRNTIAPQFASGAGFVSWRAWIVDDENHRTQTEYFDRPTGVRKSRELHDVVGQRGRLSLSPVVSILDRETTLQTCKEADQTLTHNDCLERPGMLLGTEVICYLRHIQKFPLWGYINEVLSLYGSHPGSGTVKAQAELNGIARLALGYDQARGQAQRRAPNLRARILIGTSERPPTERHLRPMRSRAFLASSLQAILMPIANEDLPRLLHRPKSKLPYLRDILDLLASRACPEDILLYCNDDIGLTTEAPQRIIHAIDRGHGVTVCPRRSHTHPMSLMRSVRNCRLDGGVDAIAMTPAWWKANRHKIPDFVIGAEGWDTVFRIIAEEWADGGKPRETVETDPHRWIESRAYVDDVCWHQPHESHWKTIRCNSVQDIGGAHNRHLASEFFSDRNNQDGLMIVAETVKKKRSAKASSDRPSDFKLHWFGEYFGRDPEVIFDIGSYDGSDARRLAARFPDADVYAFEPDPTNFKILSRLCRGTRVQPCRLALSDRSGIAEYYPIGHTGSKRQKTENRFDTGWKGSGGIMRPESRLLRANKHLLGHKPFRVPTATIAQVCTAEDISHLDLIHMDVQGAEGLVLSGLGALLPSMIFLEIAETENYKGAWPLDRLYGHLLILGYERVWHSERDALFIFPASK